MNEQVLECLLTMIWTAYWRAVKGTDCGSDFEELDYCKACKHYRMCSNYNKIKELIKSKKN